MSLNEKEWFTEAYENNTAFSVRFSKKLFETKSEFQKIEVYQTPVMGRVLSLDGCFMVTDKDAFVYHEMLTHPSMSMISHPETALVIGGGDGGAITELVKYPTLKSITLCEIDAEVVSTCKKFFPEISSGLSDSRVKVVCLDGAAYVKTFQEEFDVILVDSTDPVGPGKALYELDFYRSVKKALKEGGVAAFQTESPLFMSTIFADTVKNLGSVFGIDSAIPYLCVIPSYPGALWSFTMCSAEPMDLSRPCAGLSDEELKALNFYSRRIHEAAFVLPNFVRELIGR
ncbi:MAG: polyamine aminopropyltransferase [Desulfomonilaceae bacterium]|jgi:spermidine synthase